MAKLGNLTAKDLGLKAQRWEKLTQGQCNNSIEAPKARALTARQIKDAAMREHHIHRAEKKFEKADSLQGKALRKLSDSWDKRTATNTKGFYDAAKVREMKRAAV